MTWKTRKKPSTGLGDKAVMELAETTDLSPRQAKELIEKFGDDKEGLMRAARNYKAEG